ncbi:MAG: pyruvate ferredoxin oxidoreductase, partial [Paracoccaceae bacterium]|nr:pyruvate ferredoxin oxidoreductase [Paracoccaceae bacterium]
LMGDAVFANMMLLGAAFQQGLVPVSEVALKQAILLNGVAVEKNGTAFDLGRIMAARPEVLARHFKDAPKEPNTLDEVLAHRADFLTRYQDAAYAKRFTDRIAQLRAALPEAGDDLVSEAAKSLFRLMAYKDEYEVARLHTEGTFEAELAEAFEGDFKVKYHLAPPLLPLGRDARGRPNKRAFGPWMRPVFKVLARMKGLRGSVFDPFALGADRKLDRQLIAWFEEVITHVERTFDAANPEASQAILKPAQEIRGYGPVRHKAADKVMADVAEKMRAT